MPKLMSKHTHTLEMSEDSLLSSSHPEKQRMTIPSPMLVSSSWPERQWMSSRPERRRMSSRPERPRYYEAQSLLSSSHPERQRMPISSPMLVSSSQPERQWMSSRPERLRYYEAQSSIFSSPRRERYEMPTSYYDDETKAASRSWPEMHEMTTNYHDDELLTDEPEIQVTSVRETALTPSQEKDTAWPTMRSIYSQPHRATLMSTSSLQERRSSLQQSLPLPEFSTSYYDDMLAEPTKESTYRPDKSSTAEQGQGEVK
ncbi:PREDICTED: uncharacterized protein LOC109589124 [Amphimedon queenslandica]|uniref:Uncharacterized protein n=1 Tax=Amphimedon queenslandica TaxID=400682 RepID=A0AAN0JV90_AMPQE|nr:PREDICTED: uncharacterized protein LOC109589124 [Amphimedon queenslandica]|eukprot:XP_019860799.1 PREDICTED: uncharacterized protein LOC109589124 [Amphimedon queenslandica]